jgi:hypothetical protein
VTLPSYLCRLFTTNMMVDDSEPQLEEAYGYKHS